MVFSHTGKGAYYIMCMAMMIFAASAFSSGSDFGQCLSECLHDGGSADECKTGICSEIDEDGDGIDDFNDTVIGTHDDIVLDGLDDIEVYVGNYMSNESEASEAKGVQEVRFVSGGRTIIAAEINASNTILSLGDVAIKKESTNNRQGMVVSGLNLSGGTKTLYVEKTKNQGSICIKDADIDSIDDLSLRCMDDDELYFGRCEEGSIETIGDYSCTVENGMYGITGLSHSGAVEMNMTGYFNGYFTVEYLNAVNGHKDGYLVGGEGIRICFESARPIQPEEHLKFIFLPGIGGLTVNEMFTPNVINCYNVQLYPENQ